MQLVCTRCYSRHFGQELDISGRYRTDTVKAGPGCPVCHGAVFDAEKVQYLECDAPIKLLLLPGQCGGRGGLPPLLRPLCRLRHPADLGQPRYRQGRSYFSNAAFSFRYILLSSYVDIFYPCYITLAITSKFCLCLRIFFKIFWSP